MRAVFVGLLIATLAVSPPGSTWAEDNTAPTPAKTTPAQGRRLALDPGHGGADLGARGAGGLVEKAAVFGLASAVAERLEAAGYHVLLTRTEDQDLTAAERAAAANRDQAELFLSLHASGVASPLARGFEVFIAPPAPGAPPGAWARGAAPGSREWAKAIRHALGQGLGTLDRGISVLPSPLLEAVAAPACLLELGNLGWAPEAELFTTEIGQAKVAELLADALDTYFAAMAPPTDGQ